MITSQYNGDYTKDGVPKEERDSDNNIIISDSTLPNILKPQLNKIS